MKSQHSAYSRTIKLGFTAQLWRVPFLQVKMKCHRTTKSTVWLCARSQAGSDRHVALVELQV